MKKKIMVYGEGVSLLTARQDHARKVLLIKTIENLSINISGLTATIERTKESFNELSKAIDSKPKGK